MKIVVYGPEKRVGVIRDRDSTVIDAGRAANVPSDLAKFIAGGKPALDATRAAVDKATEGVPLSSVKLHAPCPAGAKIACAGGNFADHAGLMFAAPTTGSTPAERFLALTIAGARKTLYIENSYFVPDDDFRRLLERAARRGVDVRVLTVNNKTDVKTTWYAGRYRYEELLQHGVRIYEYQPTMLHSKTIVADGAWSSVGSMNFDNRSLAFNDEANLVVLDSAFGAQMDSIFFDDLRYAKEIKLAEFRQRSMWSKALELGATLLSRVL